MSTHPENCLYCAAGEAMEHNYEDPDNYEEEATYSIVRFVFQGDNEVIASGLTLEEAQEHCQRDDTHGDGWFDGYREEG